MKDTIAPQYRTLFENKRLNEFEQLWAANIPAVDAPNLERGGHSEVGLLELDTPAGVQRFYVKRQTNHLGRSFKRPGGEPTFAREFRNIHRFARMGIPALSAAWYGERRGTDGWRAILVTPALAGFEDLVALHERWETIDASSRQAIIASSARLVRQLHRARWMHGSLYAKHIFLKPTADGHYQAKFIDLEKARPMLYARRERLRDLDVLMRRLPRWDYTVQHAFFAHYLDQDPTHPKVAQWQRALAKRTTRKRSAKRGKAPQGCAEQHKNLNKLD